MPISETNEPNKTTQSEPSGDSTATVGLLKTAGADADRGRGPETAELDLLACRGATDVRVPLLAGKRTGIPNGTAVQESPRKTAESGITSDDPARQQFNTPGVSE